MSAPPLPAIAGLRYGPRHTIAEFRLPVGRELPAVVRRMTVPEFCIALELVATTMNTLKGNIVQCDTSIQPANEVADLRKELDAAIQQKHELYSIFTIEKADIVHRYEALIKTFERALVEVKTSIAPAAVPSLTPHAVEPVDAMVETLKGFLEEHEKKMALAKQEQEQKSCTTSKEVLEVLEKISEQYCILEAALESITN